MVKTISSLKLGKNGKLSKIKTKYMTQTAIKHNTADTKLVWRNRFDFRK